MRLTYTHALQACSGIFRIRLLSWRYSRIAIDEKCTMMEHVKYSILSRFLFVSITEKANKEGCTIKWTNFKVRGDR